MPQRNFNIEVRQTGVFVLQVSGIQPGNVRVCCVVKEQLWEIIPFGIEYDLSRRDILANPGHSGLVTVRLVIIAKRFSRLKYIYTQDQGQQRSSKHYGDHSRPSN